MYLARGIPGGNGTSLVTRGGGGVQQGDPVKAEIGPLLPEKAGIEAGKGFARQVFLAQGLSRAASSTGGRVTYV